MNTKRKALGWGLLPTLGEKARTHWGKLAATIALTMAALSGAHAAPYPCVDSFGYTCREEVSNYLPVSTPQFSMGGDEVGSQYPLPFPFRFYGALYSNMWVTSNGMLSFLSFATVPSPSIPSTYAPNSVVAPFWDDLFVGPAINAPVAVETRGTAPNRQVVIEWYNVAFCCSATSPRISAQAILHENGEILFQYSGIDAANSRERGGNALIGIENQLGTVGLQYSNKMPVLSDGLAIRFLPPAPDSTGPAIVLTRPANGSEFALNDSVLADYSCTDPSGVQSCQGTVASGAAIDTSSVGTKAFKVEGVDTRGFLTVVNASYRVLYQFGGFQAPVDRSTPDTQVLNVMKAGSAVPLKFSLNGYQGLDIFSAGSPASKVVNCAIGDSSDALEEIAPAGASGLRYDAATDTYHYVWKTDKAWQGTCRALIVTLKDGSQHTAYFDLRK